ncbi:MAG: AsnC family transcriptional regulator [Candidatus Micrarchaeota archaeon]|nr:AsnC family transcriptional regulator [Candidatus Micrarchaeota archaeon]MDE1849240.1 AsnC family transcriptional regulator [Candidatus Micrarchaeota archaeon]
MVNVPQKIAVVFEQVKKEYHPARVVLKRISEKYYVYKDHGIWLKDKHKTKIISEYLGKITDEGLYIKKTSSAKDDLENAKALIAEYGGKIIWYEKGESKEPQMHETTVADVDLKLLTALSMNARLPMARLAEIAGINEQTAHSRVEALEKRLGIKYLLEIDVEKLGYIQYLILIKFDDTIPTTEELRRTIANEPRIQFVATTKGEYDVVVYVIDENPLKAHDNLVKLRSKSPINNYRAHWTLTYFAPAYSFMPLTESFIENILKDRVWHRTREEPRPDKNQLRYREFILLKELNNQSIRNFTSIDEKYALGKGTSRYTYRALVDREIIKRSTISMTNLKMSYLGMIVISNVYYKAIQENRYKFLKEEIGYGKISNKYSLSGNVGSPTNGAIIFLPITEEEHIEDISKTIEDELQGSTVKSLVVTDIISGFLCHRRFDNTYSRAYKLLLELKKIEPVILTSYA